MMRRTFSLPHNQKNQSGNIFFMLFAAVALVGAFGVGSSNMLKGLVSSMSDVTRKTVAEERMTTAAKIAFQYPAENAPSGGDCDADTPGGTAPLQFAFIEPILTRAAGALPAPVNGGLIPLDIGLNTTDPWGTQYGYCAWDPGDDQCADSIAPRRLAGSIDPTKTVVAIISAGRDRRFSTTCNAFPNTGAVTRAAGGDDVVMEFAYDDMRGMGGEDLWKVKSTDPDTATIEKNIEVGGGGTFTDAINLMQKGLILPTDADTGPCTAPLEGQLQLDTTTSPFTLKMCRSGTWTALAMGASSSGSTPTSPEGYTPPGSGLLAWWTFDSDTGSTATDITSNAIPGTLAGNASFVAGQFGKALALDGTGDYLSIGVPSVLNNTIKSGCARIKLDNVTKTETIWDKSNGANQGHRYILNMDTGSYTDYSTASFHGLSADNNGYGLEFSNVNGDWDPSGYFFTCATWDGAGTNNSVSTYVNTDQAAYNVSNSYGASSDAAFNLIVGATSAGAGGLQGTIDEVIFYDRKLTSGEVANLAYGPLNSGPPYDSSLVAYYKLDDGLGTVATDSSGNGHDAVLSGFSPSTAWASGYKGGALTYDGTDDVLNAGSAAAFDNLNGTICLWAKSNSNTGTKTLFAKGSETANPRLYINYAGTWQSIYTGYGTAYGPSISNSAQSDWNFYCAVLSERSVFASGNFSNSSATLPSNDSPYDLLFGAGPGAANYFSGQIDEIQIYNRRLTQQEMNALFALGTAMPKGGVLMRDGTRVGASSASSVSVEPNGSVVTSINKYVGKLAAKTAQHTCFLKDDKSIWCTGLDTDGQLGNGSVLTTDQQSPSKVQSNDTFVQVTGGTNNTCALRSDGRAFCWGRNNSGQIGNGVTGGSYDIPIAVSGTNIFFQITSGLQATCGIRNDGLLLCWGDDAGGRLANGAGGSSNIPVVSGDTDQFVKISSGFDHFCGIKSTGSIWCWGAGSSGEMGNGTTTAANELPVEISEPGPWVDVSAGKSYTCGIKLDGSAWCWGNATSGKLGIGITSGTILTPQKLPDLGPWLVIAAGQVNNTTATCGIKIDGSAWCWGWGANGRLGNANTADQSLPVRVLDPGPWANIESGASHACGMKTDGSVWCWSNDFYGQLGNGPSNGNKNVPFKVSSEPDAQVIAWNNTQSQLTFTGTNNVAMNGNAIQAGEKTVFSPENGLLFGSGGSTALNQTVSTTSDSSLPVISGLIGYWPLDGASDNGGTQYATDTINNLQGTLNGGPSFVPAIRGNGLYLDGVDDNVTIPTTEILNNTVQSACLWIMYETQPTTITTLISKGNATTTGFRLYAGDGATGDLGVFSDGSYTVNDSAMPVGEWHHVCGTWSGSSYAASSLIVYKDGVALSSTASAATGAALTDSAINLIFGDSAAASDNFKGIIDDIMIFNRELSAAEVAKLYARTGLPGVELTLQSAASGSAQMTWKSSHVNFANLGLNYSTKALELRMYVAPSSQWVHSVAGSANVQISESGFVGIKTSSSPTAALDINGGLRLGNDTTECSVVRSGTLRYVGGTNVYEYCNGTAWVGF